MAKVVKCDECDEIVRDDQGQSFIEVEFNNWVSTFADPGVTNQFCSKECVGKYFAPEVPF